MLLPTVYEDAGLSGGTLERPGLQRLLADIDAGLVEQIVVYKVDRLTRSLSDFAKLVERLEAAGAVFVSVTQSFNTATSMGRLTLHMLLSFAQFEREVTAERIRDKIAASKRKGLWMGGRVPLGYEKDGRTLCINEAEAETVRTSPSARCAPVNGLAGCYVSTIGKPHEYFDLTTSNPKRPGARVLSSFVFLDTPGH